ncbi:MAG TPA: 23S rRNA (pseudouridine(1915)-N(3))-methyltransferase RlmH [Micropepsaceae bacterium]|nr:23S rRNA (pseudouridine(1915)-N(3))-methyltransferase RlmH [Micropepsaceae bacterium]
MRITALAVGRARASAEQGLCDVHWERAAALGGKLGFTKLDFLIVDTSRGSSSAARMDDEAKKLTARMPSAAHRIALDEGGRSLSSEAFAKHLASLRDSGVRDLAFLIGGPDGLAAPLREGAQERLAFGPQTWPHLLVRAMLAEQVYRAFAILSGHPYHRSRTA